MKNSTAKSARRAGFTLVELLVAAALSILIMAVIATAFQTGLQTLSTLKSLGDMAERLKTTETMLRSDLEAEHFATGTGDDSPGSLHVSDLQYHLASPTPAPTGGYFQIAQGAASFLEGNDADGLISSRADGNTEKHRLSMTVKKTGKAPEHLFTADLSQLNAADRTAVSGQSISDIGVGNRLVSQWAQVDWYLDTSRAATVNGITTWPLIRRVRLLVPQSAPPLAPLTTTPILTASDVLSLLSPPATQVNTIQTIATPSNRFVAGPIQSSSPKYGDDIVITNVISFEVRPLYTPGAGVPATTTLADGIFADLPGTASQPAPVGGQFDTGLGAVGNNRIRVMGIQVKVRVYDVKNKLTRQLTVVSKL